ncbi:MAG: glycosyltransferase [Magnetococcales bacterium]|nr:glycosyltransferase [Magnetococcales bacterium]
MTQTPEQALQAALLSHNGGQMEEAEHQYRTVLRADPHHPTANHNLGVLMVQTGQAAQGLPYLITALETDPAHEMFWLSYLDALIAADRLAVASQVVAQSREMGVPEEGIERLKERLEHGITRRGGVPDAPNASEAALRATLNIQSWNTGSTAAGRGDPPLVLFDWLVHHTFGWGVYGLNLVLNGSAQGRITPASTAQDRMAIIGSTSTHHHVAHPNPLAQPIMDHFYRNSMRLYQWMCHKSAPFTLPWPVLHGLGNGLHITQNRMPNGLRYHGAPSIGILALEQTRLDQEARDRAARLALIVTCSSWNTEILEDAGIGPAITVIQGIDPTLFHPAPRAGWLKHRFTVFSGGKLEFRKGQDLVLLAFRAFARRHPEALLVTAWHSPWPELARNLATNPKVAPVPFEPTGRVDVTGWAVANGLAPEQVLDLGQVPNTRLPPLLREMDVALFPNRGEGGTNLVAMECMACGVPVILSRNTGHLDLIQPDNCLPLEWQKPMPDRGLYRGWGESNVEEMVEALETCYQEREPARQRGAKGAAMMGELTWSRQIARLTDAIAPYCGWS